MTFFYILCIALAVGTVHTIAQTDNRNLPGTLLPNDPLHPFAISQPLLTPYPAPPAACTQRLIDPSFPFSFGLPAVTSSAPPPESAGGETGSWTRVVLTFSATSN